MSLTPERIEELIALATPRVETISAAVAAYDRVMEGGVSLAEFRELLDSARALSRLREFSAVTLEQLIDGRWQAELTRGCTPGPWLTGDTPKKALNAALDAAEDEA